MEHFVDPALYIAGDGLDCVFEVLVFESFCGEDLANFFAFAFGVCVDVVLFDIFGFVEELFIGA